ncbi:unnamed protein product [Adineta ricciae]|uniref:EF-hand domain-containing protein n=1 Tax=Adineta ricciae TaxID=249248 RepID=A0A815NGP9_ADIRI|nr:unnamed protein product [Adineta ricciae]
MPDSVNKNLLDNEGMCELLHRAVWKRLEPKQEYSQEKESPKFDRPILPTVFKHECPSGKMNLGQFRKYYDQVVRFQDRDGNLANHMYAVFDKNHDVSIDFNFNEHVLAFGAINRKDMNTELRLVFELLDQLGDGLISYDEIEKFITISLKITDPNETQSPNDSFSASLVPIQTRNGRRNSLLMGAKQI